MQQAIPYKSWTPLHSASHFSQSDQKAGHTKAATGNRMVDMVSENAVIVIARRGCCMSHVMKRLLLGLGVNPAVYEVDEKDEKTVLSELETFNGGKVKVELPLPAVFIGGKLFGGLDRLMATHITGELIPTLKEAGALWL